MTSKADDRIGPYLAQAEGWARDRQEELRSSRRVAWIVALAAVSIAVLEALALLVLMPLKRVEPYTLMVDRQTGYVQLLRPLDPQLVSSDAALTQSFLVQYVIAREGFDIDSLQNDYRKVAAWSAGSARTDYIASMPATNPASPLARYPRTSVVDVRVKSVTSLGNHVALVRFETMRRDAGQQGGVGRPWMAVIRYGYADRAMSTSERYINPLGFQVMRYRRSAENVVPDVAPAPVVAPTMTSGQPPVMAMPSRR